MIRKLFFIAALFCLGGCNPPIPEPIKLGMNDPYYGYIDKGEKFGIRIGMSRIESRKILTDQGQDDPDEGVCKAGHKIDCPPGQVFDGYYRSGNVPTERNRKIPPQSPMKYGWIFVFIENDKVVAVGWSFYNSNIDP